MHAQQSQYQPLRLIFLDLVAEALRIFSNQEYAKNYDRLTIDFLGFWLQKFSEILTLGTLWYLY